VTLKLVSFNISPTEEGRKINIETFL